MKKRKRSKLLVLTTLWLLGCTQSNRPEETIQESKEELVETIDSSMGFSFSYEEKEKVVIDEKGITTIYLNEMEKEPYIRISKGSISLEDKISSFEEKYEGKMVIEPDSSFEMEVNDKEYKGYLGAYLDEELKVHNELILVDNPLIYEVYYGDEEAENALNTLKNIQSSMKMH